VITVAILTVSDSAHEGRASDVSGPEIRRRCEQLGWNIAATSVVPDEADLIAAVLKQWTDDSVASLILTTGGTGLSRRDVTPEATRAVIDREIPGFGELMRAKGLEQTPFAVLSRALAGTRSRSLIVNLPGSPKGALHSLDAVRTQIPHVVRLLEGHTEHENENRLKPESGHKPGA
jgi:molybdopterin adenylyltransferase